MSNPRVAVLILAFFNVQDIKGCLETLVKSNGVDLDIFILENPSPYTQEMVSMCSKFNTHITKYLLASSNMEMNIFTMAINTYKNLLNTYDYIAISEGDITIENGAVRETINIINNHNKGCCSVDFNLCNLKIPPLPPAAINWVPKPRDIPGADFRIGETGLQFITFQKKFLFDFVEAINNQKYSSGTPGGVADFTGFSDNNLGKFHREIYGHQRYRTKNNRLIHTGWNHFYDKNDEYWKFRTHLIQRKKIRVNKDISADSFIEINLYNTPITIPILPDMDREILKNSFTTQIKPYNPTPKNKPNARNKNKPKKLK